MWELCHKSGASDKAQKVDCVMRLQDKLSTRSAYDKVFSKIWDASGTKYKFSHNITTFCDYFRWLLLFMRHQPNVVIVDMAHMVAAHGNNRMPGMPIRRQISCKH